MKYLLLDKRSGRSVKDSDFKLRFRGTRKRGSVLILGEHWKYHIELEGCLKKLSWIYIKISCSSKPTQSFPEVTPALR